jgi:hypothetical protein
MARGPVARIRRVLGARLHLLQVQYEAAARAVELQPAIESLESASTQSRAQLEEAAIAQREQMAELQAAVAELREAVAELSDRQAKQLRLSTAQYDDLGRLREKLVALRRTDSYAATFANRRPLISVPIATYNAAEPLVDRAIASVRAQTYDRWEIVIVGDGCTDDTAERIEQLGDDRIRFVNLPFRTVYPDDPQDRWRVSGAAPWNRAVELCEGEWIAPLDDDDELLPGHMETLLELALRSRAEYAYGRLVSITPDGNQYSIFSFPPEYAQVGMQSAIYLRALAFIECDTRSWALDEPADWNCISRMRDAGVLMAATEEPVSRYYPSQGSRTNKPAD